MAAFSDEVVGYLSTIDSIPAKDIPAAIARLAARCMAAAVAQTTGNSASPVADPADELLSPREAAKVLRTSVKYVYANSRALGAIRLGKGSRARLRFRRATLLKRLAA